VREHRLNPRQSAVVEWLLENPELRLENLAGLFPEVNRRTLQRDLRGLVEAGVLESSGAARAVFYKLRIKGL